MVRQREGERATRRQGPRTKWMQRDTLRDTEIETAIERKTEG